MDTFFEQIVSIEKSGKKIAAFIAIWVLALLLCGVIFLMSGIFGSLVFLLMAGTLYGAYKLSGLLNVEYEYIITIACDVNDANDYLLVYEKNGKAMNLVFAPDKKMQTVVAKYLPKYISNSLFK